MESNLLVDDRDNEILFNEYVCIIRQDSLIEDSSWTKLMLRVASGENKLCFYRRSSTEDTDDKVAFVYSILPSTTVKIIPINSSRGSPGQNASSGVFLATADEIIVIVGRTSESTAKLRDELENKIQLLRKKSPHKVGTLYFSRKHRKPAKFSIVLEKGCICFYIPREETGRTTATKPVSVIYLDPTVEIMHLNFDSYKDDPNNPISTNDKIDTLAYAHFADKFNFGFVLFTANDYESPNVFLFELENERNDWIFFIKHSILVAKYDLTVNHAKVYMFLEDNNLEKFALKLIERGFSSIARVGSMDRIDVCWCARNLQMNPEDLENFARAVFKLQTMHLTMKRSKAHRKYKAFISHDKSETETSIELLKDALNKFNSRKSTYDDLLKEFVVSQKSMNIKSVSSKGQNNRGTGRTATYKFGTTSLSTFKDSSPRSTLDGTTLEDLESMRENEIKLKQNPKKKLNLPKVPRRPIKLTQELDIVELVPKQVKPQSQPVKETKEKEQVGKFEPIVVEEVEPIKVEEVEPIEVEEDVDEDSDDSDEADKPDIFAWGNLPSSALPSVKPILFEKCPVPASIENGIAFISKKRELYFLNRDNSFKLMDFPQVSSLSMRTTVTAVSCGANHFAAVVNGDLFSWGKGNRGQLGLGNVLESATPAMVEGVGYSYSELPGDRVISVACGLEHTVVLTSTGAVFTMGSHDNGMLGLGDIKQDVTEPTLVEELLPVTIGQIAVGDTFSIAIALTGRRVYKFGKLASRNDNLLPTLIDNFPPENKEVNQLYAAGRNCIFLLADDDGSRAQVYTYGSDIRVLGQGKLKKIPAQPGLVHRLKDKQVINISCSSRHMSAVTCNGHLFSWGYGKSGELGTKKILGNPAFHPRNQRCVQNLKAVNVSCGNGFTVGVFSAVATVYQKKKNSRSVTAYGYDSQQRYTYQSVKVPERFRQLELQGSFVQSSSQFDDTESINNEL